ncbi:MAG: N-acetyltransferase family protein [bacterium]
MEEIVLKDIQEKDLSVVLDIYNYYILTSTATFHLEPIPMDKLRGFIYLNHFKYKAYLIYYRNELAGFCFLTQYKNLVAYDRTVEIGIYLKPEYTHQGLGKQAIPFLEQVAKKNGFKIIIASISGENEPSLKLFRNLGYQECGYFKRVGEKFGRVIDVVYFQKSLEKDAM